MREKKMGVWEVYKNLSYLWLDLEVPSPQYFAPLQSFTTNDTHMPLQFGTAERQRRA